MQKFNATSALESGYPMMQMIQFRQKSQASYQNKNVTSSPVLNSKDSEPHTAQLGGNL